MATVTSISHTWRVVGNSLTIDGTFDDPTVVVDIADGLGGWVSCTVTSASPTQVVITIPSVGDASRTVRVTDTNGEDTSQSVWVLAATPTITSVSPDNGDPDGGLFPTVTWSFPVTDGSASIRFGGVAGTGSPSSGATSTNVVATPAHASGVVDVSIVDTVFGTITAGGEGLFEYYFGVTSITSVSPSTLTANVAEAVTITGEFRLPITTVHIYHNGSPHVTMSVTSSSATQIVCQYAGNASSGGTKEVRVTDANGLSGGGPVTINVEAPEVDSATPATVVANVPTEVVLAGSYFDTGSAVVTASAGTINSQSIDSSSQITLDFEHGVAGTITLTVTQTSGVDTITIEVVNPSSDSGFPVDAGFGINMFNLFGGSNG